MSTIHAIILGIIQGITEFLPVSSSGHLLIFQTLLGFEALSHYLVFDLVCHLGTLAAIFVIFHREVREALHSPPLLKNIFIALLPLFPLLLVMKQVKGEFESLEHLGYFYLLSAGLLTAGIFSKEKDNGADFPWWHALWIGAFQALAILPGISRSGATITAALLLGWSLPHAVRFSFLLVIPTILGGFFYEMIKHSDLQMGGVRAIDYAAGFSLSFVVGMAALFFLKVIKSKKTLIPFAIYCLLVGLFIIFVYT